MSGITLRRPLLATLMTVTAAALAPAASHAAVIASTAPSFPATVTVGQTGVPASLRLTNANTAPNAGDLNTVCNTGDSSPPCGNPEPGIVLLPSCGLPTPSGCHVAGADPGVFGVSPTATGRVGTDCAGTTFTTAVVDIVFRTIRFTPSPGAPVRLPGSGAACTIDFTLAVLACPTVDSNPALPGIQTSQRTTHTQFGPFSLSDTAFATSQTTVQCSPVNHSPSCAAVSGAPTTLWPPNHAYRLITLGGGTDPDGDTVTLTVTAVTQDEPLLSLGDGFYSPDATPASASHQVFLRAERSIFGNGRVYRIAFGGSDGHGGTCTGSVAVGVPLDQFFNPVAVDSGQTVNSFGP